MSGGALVAPEQEDEGGVGRLPEAIRHQLKLARIANEARKEMAKMSWGASLDQRALGAIAEWGRVYGVDVTQEIDLLGGRVYLNARYYLRRLADLITAGRVEYAHADHIHDDTRLKELGTDGDTERHRRLKERIKYNVPEKAAAAVAFRVKVRDMEMEVVGVNWAGGGVRKSDPVGEAEPVKTAESRAARRAMRQLVGHVKEAEDVEAMVETLKPVEAEVERARELAKAEQQRALTAGRPGVPDSADVYAETEAPRKPPREVATEEINMGDKPTTSTLFDGEPDIFEPGDAAEGL